MKKPVIITILICIAVIAGFWFYSKNKQPKLDANGNPIEDLSSEEDSYADESDSGDEGDVKTSLLTKFGVGTGNVKAAYVALPQTIKNKGACEAACNGAHMFNKKKRNSCKSKCK